MIDADFYINKVFEADFIKAAYGKAMAYANRLKSKKYGKEAVLEMVGTMGVKQYHKHLPKPKKAKNKSQPGKQLPLFEKS